MPLKVVLPTVRRVTEPAPTVLVPRLWTLTVNVTFDPTAGLAGLEVIPVTSRSGPGLWPTVSSASAVRLLLLLSCSEIVSVGSTTAETVYLPCARLPMVTGTVADSLAPSAGTGALPATVPSRLTFTVVAAAAAEPMLLTMAFILISSLSVGCGGSQERSARVRSGLGAAVPMTWNSATWPPYPELLLKIFSCTSA